MTTIVAVTNKDLYRAAVIASRVENDFVTGMQVAKLNELKARMRREVVKFAYMKKDKSIRVAYGTLMSALVGDHINGVGNGVVNTLRQHSTLLVALCSADMLLIYLNYLQPVEACIVGQISYLTRG